MTSRRLGHGVAGIYREIHQHLIQACRVGMDEQRLHGKFELHLDVFAEDAHSILVMLLMDWFKSNRAVAKLPSG